jgi:hypothetical protein
MHMNIYAILIDDKSNSFAKFISFRKSPLQMGQNKRKPLQAREEKWAYTK